MKIFSHFVVVGLYSVILVGSATMPAHAGDPVIDAKIELLDRQVKALQARLGSSGSAATVQPSAPVMAGEPVQDRVLLADLMAKVGALESQMRSLTGSMEEYDYRLRQQDDAIALLRKELELQREDTAAAIAKGNQQVQGTQATTPAGVTPPAATPNQVPKTVVALPKSSPSEQYKYAFAFVQKNDLENGRIALEKFIEENPKDELSGNARFWLGRVHLQEGRSGLAAQQLLALIEENPNHPKRADALVDLADALVKLDSSEDACNALAEFRRVKSTDTSRLQERANRVAKEAKCS
ncbi:tetratricopeptide repeat protein [Kordiimonas pumila]|uniref:Tetratricopeptide repeat protein n=1 Tax=Kordiimonas pumila TaxID=2161677 RepID=A0ABV7D8W9_9PROT|nr:tetratricopeptide repeat protein [Kordiimonas pumila]